ncbi:MAG TPA: glycosyltransferase family 4 protein [Blastocatellia bacterium]|nr:glycosyltransferase family 4 protein [Blastocatellia bacterium]
MRRVLLLNNVPAPYFDPLFERIGRESGWRLTVCYSSDWNKDVGWGKKVPAEEAAHRTIILDRRSPWLKSKLGSSLAAAIALANNLIAERPDYLICYGYTLAPQMTALLWAMATRTPFAVIGDANYNTDMAKGLKRLAKRFWLRALTKRAAALIAVGAANRAFWESYRARPEQLYEARFAVDNEFFAWASAERREDARRWRERAGLSDKVVFLYVGRLIKRKNVDLIIGAAQQINDERIAVVVAGDGEERASLEALANGASGVTFVGAVAPDDLPLYYAAADALILPADREPWGLVINEAMACGLAVIAHGDCGAAVDLVGPDVGVKLRTFSVHELAEAMRLVGCDAEKRQAMRQRALAKIQMWSIAAAAQGIIRAIESSSGAATKARSRESR